MATNNMNNSTRSAVGWIVIILMLLQFIPLDRVEQPSKPPATIPESLLAPLEARCFACHSAETRWPRSAYIAPLSWYVTGKVRQARETLDFSNFDALPEDARRDVEKSVSRLAGSNALSAHGAIPGFPAIRMSERERRILTGWGANNNREQNDRINNSAH